MIALTLAEVAEATEGRLHGDGALVVSGPVVTDARQCEPGSLYVARAGEHADGHDYVGQAVERGAVAALTAREVPGAACVVVPDVQEAFARLARAVLHRVPELTTIAVTGSAGKTGAKDLLAQVLPALGATVGARESFNGEVGVPLTVLRVHADTRYLVLEMGARGAGHIAYLTRIAPPDIAVVLNVGSAHLGEFGSVEAIAAAKGELVADLAADALAVLNADDPLVLTMAARTRARVVLVGRGPAAQVRADHVELDGLARASFRLVAGGATAPVRLRLHGEHHVGNALAVAAVALDLGLPLQRVAEELSAATAASRWRMEVTERSDGVTVVNDAYNANPDSMRAALAALVAMSAGRRSWAVLGEMLELGPTSAADHDAVGRLAARLDVCRLLAVGEGARPIHTGATQQGSRDPQARHVPDADAAQELLERELRPGDVVLLKSSRDAGLRWLGDRLAGKEVVPR